MTREELIAEQERLQQRLVEIDQVLQSGDDSGKAQTVWTAKDEAHMRGALTMSVYQRVVIGRCRHDSCNCAFGAGSRFCGKILREELQYYRDGDTYIPDALAAEFRRIEGFLTACRKWHRDEQGR